MTKRGFTLAEVIITLGIIGVVAALTVPTLVENGKNKANAAKLSVVISNLDNAFGSMIAKEGVSDLYGTKTWAVIQGVEWEGEGAGSDDANNVNQINASSSGEQVSAFVGQLGQYLNISGFEKVNQTSYYTNNGTTGPYGLSSNGSKGNITTGNPGITITLKNGAVMFIRAFANGDGHTKTTQAEIDAVIAAGGSLMSDAADISIDVNGIEGPNTYGRDIFGGYLGSDGVFYPSGSVDISIYDKGDTTNVWNNSSSQDWACLPEQNVVTNGGHGCTARVVEEGFKINY